MDRDEYTNRLAGGVLYARALLVASAMLILFLITLFFLIGFLEEGFFGYAIGDFVLMALFSLSCFRNFLRMREIRRDMRGE